MSQKVKNAADCCTASTNKIYIQPAMSIAKLRGLNQIISIQHKDRHWTEHLAERKAGVVFSIF